MSYRLVTTARRYFPLRMPRRALIVASTALLAAACGAGHPAPRKVSRAPAGSHVLSGCYSLPFSGGTADLLPLNFYRVNATSSAICFHVLRAGSKCSQALGWARSYGDPIVDSDEPRPGSYLVTYYPSEHRWFLVPQCPTPPPAPS